MKEIIKMADYEPQPGLLYTSGLPRPISVGEKVALKEDHLDDELRGQYGIIRAIGYDPEIGDIVMEIALHDPAVGAHFYESEDGRPADPITRITIEDIQ